jgi:hypothetical protein
MYEENLGPNSKLWNMFISQKNHLRILLILETSSSLCKQESTAYRERITLVSLIIVSIRTHSA